MLIAVRGNLSMLQVGILQKMQPCRNVVRLRGCFESNEEVMVVTDMCKGGDLQKLSDVSSSRSLQDCQCAIVKAMLVLLLLMAWGYETHMLIVIAGVKHCSVRIGNAY
jgi:serine/threonine protein kinase